LKTDEEEDKTEAQVDEKKKEEPATSTSDSAIYPSGAYSSTSCTLVQLLTKPLQSIKYILACTTTLTYCLTMGVTYFITMQ